MTDWAKPFLIGQNRFLIANLYRTDLTRIELTYEQIAALSDLDMLKIAQQLGARYLESVFITHLGNAVNDLLLEKENKTNGNT